MLGAKSGTFLRLETTAIINLIKAALQIGKRFRRSGVEFWS